ncbi:hypothetical protein CPB85DRAFT_631497 [Mucidula mucida]|nr:hypothetical protein CPB85DRAFT_631497 [Mucidula mucida]
MSNTQKFETGKQHKDTADQAFKAGEYKKALSSYYQALMYLQGLDKNALSSMGMSSPQTSRAAETDADKELAEIDDVISKVYSNMSACHMSLHNWQRAIETADKALKKNEKNYRALFRKGKALGEQGFFERSIKVLEEVKSKNPEDAPKVDAEIVRLRASISRRRKPTTRD